MRDGKPYTGRQTLYGTANPSPTTAIPMENTVGAGSARPDAGAARPDMGSARPKYQIIHHH